MLFFRAQAIISLVSLCLGVQGVFAAPTDYAQGLYQQCQRALGLAAGSGRMAGSTGGAPSSVAATQPVPDLRAILVDVAQALSPELARLNTFDQSYQFASLQGGDLVDLRTKARTHVNSFDLQLTPIPQWMTVLWLISTEHIAQGYGQDYRRWPHFRDDSHEGDNATVHYGRWYTRRKSITFNYDHPTENQSPQAIGEFLKWLNSIPAIAKSRCRFRLPTSEEWLWAVQASVGADLISGTISGGVNATGMVVNRSLEDVVMYRDFIRTTHAKYGFYAQNSQGRTHNLRLLEPLPSGLRHMFGNVWHLLSSGDSFFNMSQIRGGSWGSPPATVAQSSFVHSETYSPDIGARLVRDCQGQ